MKAPKVSVVVPNYNHHKFLEKRLDSIFNQTFQDFEVILLDDASTDGSQEILIQNKKHPKVSLLLINESNSGSPFEQWKRGIELAKGEYIWIAESDDYCDPRFLEKIFQNESAKVGIYYSQTIDVDEHGVQLLHRQEYTRMFLPNIWETDFKLDGKLFIEKYLVVKNVIPNASAVIFRRDLIDENTFSNELLNMKMCGDWLFWVLISKKTNLLFISETLNFFRNHQNISRLHVTIDQKKLRLKEEAIIRREIIKSMGISNAFHESELYQRWYSLHKLAAIYSSDFYSIVINPKKILIFILGFLKAKLK